MKSHFQYIKKTPFHISILLLINAYCTYREGCLAEIVKARWTGTWARDNEHHAEYLIKCIQELFLLLKISEITAESQITEILYGVPSLKILGLYDLKKRTLLNKEDNYFADYTLQKFIQYLQNRRYKMRKRTKKAKLK